MEQRSATDVITTAFQLDDLLDDHQLRRSRSRGAERGGGSQICHGAASQPENRDSEQRQRGCVAPRTVSAQRRDIIIDVLASS